MTLMNLTSNNIQYGVTSGVIFLADQSALSLPNLGDLKLNICLELFVHLSVFHMIGWSKMNERLPDMTHIVQFLMIYFHCLFASKFIH